MTTPMKAINIINQHFPVVQFIISCTRWFHVHGILKSVDEMLKYDQSNEGYVLQYVATWNLPFSFTINFE